MSATAADLKRWWRNERTPGLALRTGCFVSVSCFRFADMPSGYICPNNAVDGNRENHLVWVIPCYGRRGGVEDEKEKKTMNNDLISRSALSLKFTFVISALRNRLFADEIAQKTIDILKNFGTLIDEAPAVDAVEVVRCKDCKYVRPTLDGRYICGATTNPNWVSADHFCSYAERKEQ